MGLRRAEAFSYAFIDELKQRGVESADLAAWRRGWDNIVNVLEDGPLKRQMDLEVTGLSCVDVANIQESWTKAFSYAFIDELKQRGVESADLAAWRRGWDNIVNVLEAGPLKRQMDLEVTGISCVDVANIQESWTKVSGDLKTTGSVVFQRNVMDQLDTLVGSLQNSIELGQSLAQLGKDHVPRKVNRVHFKSYCTSYLYIENMRTFLYGDYSTDNLSIPFDNSFHQHCKLRMDLSNSDIFISVLIEKCHECSIFTTFENLEHNGDVERLVSNLDEFQYNNKVNHGVLGGTFDSIHFGHKLLLCEAALRCSNSPLN
ncbi:hypothetical protein QYM36_006824 [Artemia franciscana]|uniref:Cytidyltransferase-like domain-containing protein n=1 Tax=Artemia franciscana TaxID=6661 RepID=A0AA88L8M7_ARTSF|nr:hypothetical protein QYM36_006824 [Artemia franciscana]